MTLRRNLLRFAKMMSEEKRIDARGGRVILSWQRQDHTFETHIHLSYNSLLIPCFLYYVPR
jgi:hypothetical protein